MIISQNDVSLILEDKKGHAYGAIGKVIEGCGPHLGSFGRVLMVKSLLQTMRKAIILVYEQGGRWVEEVLKFSHNRD